MAAGATAAHVIEAMAQVTGALPTSFLRVGRALREASPELWPEGSPGRNRAGIPTPEQMVNLVIAYAGVDSYPDAPRVAETYATMVPHGRQGAYVENAADEKGQIASAGVLEPNIWRDAGTQWEGIDLLRVVLAGLIRQLADPGMREQMRPLDQELLLTIGSRPSAALSHKEPSGWRIADIYAPPQSALPLAPSPVGEIVRTARVPFAVFETLGKLWQVTEESRRAAPPLPVPPAATTTAAPETENADPLPQGPALIRDHNRDLRDHVPMAGHSEARGVCANTQAPSSRASGQSPKRQRIEHHERWHPAFASGA